MSNEQLADFRAIFEGTPDAYLILTPSLHVVAANDFYLKTTNTVRDEIVGKYLFDVFPENADVSNTTGSVELKKSLFTAIKTKQPHSMRILRYDISDPEYPNRFQEKYWRPVNIPIVSKSGEVIYIVNTVRDITKMLDVVDDVVDHQTEPGRKAEGGSMFRTMVENLPNLAWMAHADGWIFWYNKRWYEYTGTAPRDMEGWGWQSVHDLKILPTVMTEWQKSIDTGKPFEMVFPLKRSDGTFRPFLTKVMPVHNTAGELEWWFGTNTDITTQKELENQKDDFIGIASHELKTPVTSIKAYVQILQRRAVKKGDHEAAQDLGRVDAQLQKLTGLIGDLLDITKFDAGQFKYTHSNFKFDTLVRDVVRSVQVTSENHKIRVKGSTKATISADRDRIDQVLVNLLNNAIKYSPDKQEIEVICSMQDGYVQVCVKDHGLGIPKEKQGHIFERFYKVSGPNMESFPGMGLGLYISAEIMRRSNGRLWVESVENEGSTFCFQLPIK